MASTAAGYSKRSSSVKRLLQEAKELAGAAEDGIHAAPFEENLYHWHFTIEGPKDSEFDGGLYHGRICLPPQYPFKAPDIMLLTPNGRFELNKKVCLTITGFHEESWQPAWGIRTALVGLSSFFTSEAKGAIGGLDAPASERRRLAALSRDWTCPGCQVKNCDSLPPRPESKKTVNVSEEATSTSAATSEDNKSETTTVIPLVEEVRPISVSNDVQAMPPEAELPKVVVESTKTTEAASTSQTSEPTSQALQQVSDTSPPPPRMNRPGPSVSASRQEVEARHLQVVELLTRQLALNDPTGGAMHHAPTAGQSVAFAAPASGSGRGSPATVNLQGSAPPMWLDGAIGAVVVALLSLVYRRFT